MKFSEMIAPLQKSKLPAQYIDRSDLEAFGTCPHQGQLRKKHSGEIETNEVLPVVGTLIHTIAEEAIKSCDMNLQDAADYITQELPKARPDLQPEVLRAGRNLANEIRRFTGNAILLCEEQISRSVMPETDTHGELLVTTAPDLVLATNKNDTIIVLDYKTGYLRRTNQEARDAFQTAVICWLLLAKYQQVQTIHFWYIETRINSKVYAKIEREKDELNFGSRIFETARLYLDGADAAWPEPTKCSQCPVQQFCKLADMSVALDFAKNSKDYLDRYVVLSEGLARMEWTLTDAAKGGRCIYGSETYFDDAPKRKPAFKASLKSIKKEESDQNET